MSLRSGQFGLGRSRAHTVIGQAAQQSIVKLEHRSFGRHTETQSAGTFLRLRDLQASDVRHDREETDLTEVGAFARHTKRR